MAKINDHYLKLQAGYLFPEIARRVNTFTEENPEEAGRLIRCGIGDVTEPLPLAARQAMHAAVDELGRHDTFRGYGPEQGYPFLREAIAREVYSSRGMNIDPSEIFVSDGSKCDTGNILDIFGTGIRIAITDPVYPVYVDTNVMIGNTGPADKSGAYGGIHYMPCTAENDFVPPSRQRRWIWFTSVTRIILPGRWQPESNSRPGSITLAPIRRSFSTMPLIVILSGTRMCRPASFNSKGPGNARLNSVPSPRVADLRARVVLGRWCPRS
jgi:hypothetical protein